MMGVGDEQGSGASADADRATRASPEPLSAQGLGHSASVPCASLPPCPFCGAPAVNVAGEYVTCGGGWSPMCAGHMVKTTPTLWNTRPSGWQPIETAPKNRKVLAGYRNALGNWRTVTACYHTQLPWSDDFDWSESDGEYAPEGWYEESETHDTILRLDAQPTHWRPLPPEPSASGMSAEGRDAQRLGAQPASPVGAEGGETPPKPLKGQPHG